MTMDSYDFLLELRQLKALPRKQLLDMHFQYFIFPARIRNILMRQRNIYTLADICKLTEEEILQWEGLGKQCLYIIKDCLTEFDLTLDMDLFDIDNEKIRQNAVLLF